MQQEGGVLEENGGLGLVGEVVNVLLECENVYIVESKGFKKESFWVFHIQYLELYTEPTAQESEYNTTCSRCGAPAYIGLNKIECSRRCK